MPLKQSPARFLDFLRDKESLTLLKASFDALASKGTKPSAEETTTREELKQKDNSVPAYHGGLHVLPLYAMLPASAQLRVFQDIPQSKRLVVVATNVVETSLTIPGIKYVVDTAKVKVKNYHHAIGVASYDVNWINKASEAQRAGRAGRVGPGHCYRLYSSGAYGKEEIFPEFSVPEIVKTPVDGVLLLLKKMGIRKRTMVSHMETKIQNLIHRSETCVPQELMELFSSTD